jgi:hypothetical protein
MEIDMISFVFGAVTAVALSAVVVFSVAFSTFVKQQKNKNKTGAN